MSQYKRLQDVARSHQLSDALDLGMRSCVLAAVGPLVKEQLEEAGYTVRIMPERVYFMKPLVTAIVRYLENAGNGLIQTQ
jgi:uroporphyrinogen-III synthase